MAELRYYQRDAVLATYRHLREKKTNPCIEITVGGGKSWVAAQIMSDTVKAWGGRVILLCHVKELLEQDLEKLNILSPDVRTGMYSAGFGKYDTDAPAIVAGIQSVYSKAEIFGHRDICIVDEAHMIQPNDEGMYGTFVEGLRKVNPKIRFIGMTATPYRLKGGLICQPQNLFNEISYSIGLKELIDKGFLSKLVAKSGRVVANLDNLHVRAGEFVAEEVEAAMMEDRVVASACREIVELTRERRSVIVFCILIVVKNLLYVFLISSLHKDYVLPIALEIRYYLEELVHIFIVSDYSLIATSPQFFSEIALICIVFTIGLACHK